MVFQYIDDSLLLSRDRQRLAHMSLRFVILCIELGIIVNFKKSELVPTQRLMHLGIDWNFATCQVQPPFDAVNKLQHNLKLLIKLSEPLLLNSRASEENYARWRKLYRLVESTSATFRHS